MTSPIEKSLRMAMRSCLPDGSTLWDYSSLSGCALRDIGGGQSEVQCKPQGAGEEYGSGDDIIILWSGVTIATYKVDFLVEGNGGARLVVECDGHDFHDRTKQQAAYDRSRDRDLLKLGIPTIRFTGSEIFHSPERCAADVYGVFKRVLAWDEAPLEAWQSGFEHGKAKERERAEHAEAGRRSLALHGCVGFAEGANAEEHF